MDTPNIERRTDDIPPEITSRDRLLVPVTAVLCFAVTVAFTSSGSPPRLGITLLLLAAQAAFFWYNGKREYKRAGLFVMGAGALLSLSLTANANMSLYPLNLLAMLVLTVWGAMMAGGSGDFDWERPRGFISGSFMAVALVFCDMNKPIRASVHGVKNRKTLKVLLGVAVSAPVLIFVVSLLGDADKQFYQLTSSLFRSFSEHLVIFASRSFMAFLLALAMYSFFYGVKSKRKVNGVPLSGGGVLKGGDGVIFLTMTTLLNAVYAVFVYIQFVYLFGGRVPDGTTYANYARQGFFELAVITLLNLSVVLLALTFTDKERRAAFYIRVTGGIMMGFTLVILASAVYRMLLYVGAYGLSVLRFFVLWGELVMLVWIALCFIKIIKPERRIFKPMAVITLALYIILNFCNMDYIIAGYNLSRADADMRYMNSLSTDTLLAGEINASKRSQAYGRSHNFWTWNITDAIAGMK